MPLLLNREVSPRQTLGIWELSEPPAELMALLGNDRLAEGYDGINHEWRQRQWLASRVLLKAITKSIDTPVKYDSFNKPYLPHSHYKISISHSHNLVAVIVDDREETGIDIELVKPRIERLAEKFMSDEETRALDRTNLVESLYVHWCAKEALYKLYGKKELIFKEHLFVGPFEYRGKGVISGSIKTNTLTCTYKLQYEKTGEHMLVYVLNS